MSSTKLLRHNRQEDVGEALLLLLNLMDDVLLKQHQEFQFVSDEMKATSVIKTMFCSSNEMKLQCTKCGQCRTEVDQVLNFYHLPNAKTLEESLDAYYVTELGQVFCVKCKINTTTLRTPKLMKAAPILCLMVSNLRNFRIVWRNLRNLITLIYRWRSMITYRSFMILALLQSNWICPNTNWAVMNASPGLHSALLHYIWVSNGVKDTMWQSAKKARDFTTTTMVVSESLKEEFMHSNVYIYMYQLNKQEGIIRNKIHVSHI